MTTPYDLVVIGGGTAGLTALSCALAVPSLERIALIEPRSALGGECANFACVPSKTILTAAKHWDALARIFPQYGILIEGKAELDMKRLHQKVISVIEDGSDDWLKDPRLTIIRDTASFQDGQTLVRQSSGELIPFKACIIATGSEPVLPEVPGLAMLMPMTYRQASQLSYLPDSMTIVGAGPVGIEYAYAFATMGVNLTLIQQEEAILPKEEPEIQAAVHQLLESRGVDILCGASVVEGLLDHTNGKALCVELSDGSRQTVKATDILIATGTRAKLDTLNLEAAGVDYTPQGITVTNTLATTNPAVWAVGDVTGLLKLTHVADYEAEVAVSQIVGTKPKTANYNGLGWGIYIEPAIAHVGLTEAQAREQYPEIVAVKAEVAEVSRNRIESQKEGFIKLIIDPQAQRLLGAHVWADQAEEMAHLLIAAVRHHMPLPQLLDLVYVYPSKSQLIQKALERYYDQ